MFEFKKVRKKPVEVEAFQLTEDIIRKIALFCKQDDVFTYMHPAYFKVYRHADKVHLMIKAWGRNVHMHTGDWIVEDVNGEIYHYTDDIFKKAYDII